MSCNFCHDLYFLEKWDVFYLLFLILRNIHFHKFLIVKVYDEFICALADLRRHV